MEMVKAAAGSPKRSSLELTEHTESTNRNVIGSNPAPQRTAKESTFRIRSWKDQCASNSSPLRDSNKLTSNTKQDHSKKRKNSQEYKLSELKQFEKQHNICEHLKSHLKGHDIDENKDTLSSPLDLGAHFTSVKRQDDRCKEHFNINYQSEGKNGYTQFSSFQQRPTEVFTHRTGRQGMSLGNKSAVHLDKVGMSKYSQTISKEDVEVTISKEDVEVTISKEDVELMKSHTNEADLSTSTPDVCKNQPVHKNKKGQNHHGDSHKNTFTSEKCCKLQEEPCARVINSKSHDLCQRCELRKTEKETLACEKNSCDSGSEFNMVKKCDPENCEQSEGNFSDCSGQVSSVVLLNDLNVEKKTFISENVDCIPIIAEPASLNIKGSCMLTESKLTDHADTAGQINSSPSLNSLVQNYGHRGNRSRHQTVLTVNKQTTTSRCFQHQLPSLATSNMPDVTKTSIGVICSHDIDRQNVSSEISPQNSCAGIKQQFTSVSDKCPGESKLLISAYSDKCSMKNKITPLSEKCVADTSATSVSLSPEEIAASKINNEYFSNASRGEVSDMKPNVSEGQAALFSQLHRSSNCVLSKSSSKKESYQPSVLQETDNQMTVQNMLLKKNGFFEQRDDQGYDNEVSSSKNIKKFENPKSLKALSASRVIAENFKTLPVQTNSKCDDTEEPLDQLILDLTESLPPKGFQQHIAHNRTSDSFTGSKLHELIKTTYPHATNTRRGFQTIYSPETFSKFSNIRSSDSGLILASQHKPCIDSKHNEENQASGNQTDQKTDMDISVDKSSYLRALLTQNQVGSKQNEYSLQFCQTSDGVDKERSAEMNESGCELQMTQTFIKTPYSDESSSYKPKNAQPVIRVLPSECHSFSYVRIEQPTGEYNSQVLEKGKQYLSATNGYESHHQMTAECFPFKKSGKDTLNEGSHNFLRTSSPDDIFSIRPYVDYTASKSTSTFGLLDQARSKTPDLKNSVSKSLYCEKLLKGRKHNSNRKGRNSSEKDGKHNYNSIKCMRHVSSSDDVENLQLYYSAKIRHSDGVKMRSQEQTVYQPKNLRYSADSCSLISNAFLHKMARLSQHNTRPVSHPHIDDSQLHSTTRRTPIHGNSSKKIQDPNAVESDIVHHTSSSHFRITPSVSKNASLAQSSSFKDISQLKYEHRKQASTPAETEDIGQEDIDLHVKDTTTSKSPLSKKAQSFFAKLTQSPMSFFYRDSKPSNPPK